MIFLRRLSSAFGQRVNVPTPVMSALELEEMIALKLAEWPFFVERTSVSKGLPVYSDVKNGRTRRLTVVRRVYGDIEGLARRLRREVDGVKAVVAVKPLQRKIVLKGDVAQQVKFYLADLGF